MHTVCQTLVGFCQTPKLQFQSRPIIHSISIYYKDDGLFYSLVLKKRLWGRKIWSKKRVPFLKHSLSFSCSFNQKKLAWIDDIMAKVLPYQSPKTEEPQKKMNLILNITKVTQQRLSSCAVSSNLLLSTLTFCLSVCLSTDHIQCLQGEVSLKKKNHGRWLSYLKQANLISSLSVHPVGNRIQLPTGVRGITWCHFSPWRATVHGSV